MIAQNPSLIVVDRNDVPIIAVEIDNQKNLTIDKAIDFRKEVLPQLGGTYTPFLLLVSQDRLFFWQANDKSALDSPPTSEASMEDVLKHYADLIKLDPKFDRLTPGMLRFITQTWLSELLRQPANVPAPAFLQQLLTSLPQGWVKRGAVY